MIDHSNNLKIPTFHIRLAFDSDYKGLPKYAPSAKTIKENQRFQLGSKSTEFISQIHIYPENIIINKTHGDVFHGNNLIIELKKQGIDTVFFTGISTDNAILFSTNTAILNNFCVIVVKDACAAPTHEAHENALHIMKGRTASEIITVEEAVKRLSQP